jgi:hypothetical protein
MGRTRYPLMKWRWNSEKLPRCSGAYGLASASIVTPACWYAAERRDYAPASASIMNPVCSVPQRGVIVSSAELN